MCSYDYLSINITQRRIKIPRLSLYRPEKGNDFRFLDRAIAEQFQIGGTDIFIHRYLGPVSPAAASPGVPTQNNVIGELGIQDVILMENRDRHYDPNVYVMRTIYTIQDLDFNLSQFGIFLNNDNIFLHLHLRSCVDTLTRKIMSGDVIELPHLKDEYALDDAMVALKRFYVVQDVTRASTGFSQTWYPHLLRVKCVPLVDSQEYKEILDAPSGDGNKTLRDILSAYNQNIAINDAIIAQAEADAPLSGSTVKQFYVLPQNIDSTSEDITASSDELNADDGITDASLILQSPNKNYYVGYLTGDGVPPNGAPYTFGTSFPLVQVKGQFHLRTDMFPNRLFRWNGNVWVKFEDNVRMTMTNNYDPATPNQDSSLATYTTKMRETQRTSFINNNNTSTIAGSVVQERQSLSKALKPLADN